MADFLKADEGKPAEGVLSDESTDRGGLTVFGHAFNSSKNQVTYWAKVREHQEAASDRADLVARLKADTELQAMARQIYKQNYWNPFNLDEMQDQALAEEIYEQAVNMGGRTSSINVQEGLNLCNMRLIKNVPVQLWTDLALDGMVGPVTHEALKACKEAGRMKHLLDVINVLQGEDYVNIARRNPTQRVYIPGWISQRVQVGAAKG